MAAHRKGEPCNHGDVSKRLSRDDASKITLHPRRPSSNFILDPVFVIRVAHGRARAAVLCRQLDEVRCINRCYIEKGFLTLPYQTSTV